MSRLAVATDAEQRDGRDVRSPGIRSARCRLCLVDLRVGGRIDDGVVVAPVPRGVAGRVGDVELGARHVFGVGEDGAQGEAELPVGAEHEGACTLHGNDIGEARVGLVFGADLDVGQSDRPRDVRGLVGEVEERIRSGRAPVVVDQVGVGRVFFEGLVGVADAARHVDGSASVELDRDDSTECVALAQVDPGTEDAPGRHRHVLVPGFGVDAAGRSGLSVERDVVLHGPEVGQPQGEHLLALPVLFEPAAVVAVHR